jgi:hypothetical protein
MNVPLPSVKETSQRSAISSVVVAGLAQVVLVGPQPRISAAT